MNDIANRRSVVLVSIDSVRADHCGHHGYERNTTPTLDAMAEGGLCFENAIAPGPSTYESMPAVVTGRHMIEYPVEGRDELDRRGAQIAANTRTETVFEWFAARGYRTAAFTTNPYTGGHTNFARGFDEYEDFLDGGEGPLMRAAAHLPVLSELKHVVTLARGDRASKPWQSYYDRIRDWLDGTEAPFFLWVFLLDPHTPYLPPDEYRSTGRLPTYYHNWRLWADKKWGLDVTPARETLERLYDDALKSADAFLERLRADLDDLDRDPVVAVHADHGEALGEHGTYGHESGLYEENIHVPLVLENVGRNTDVERPVSLTELPDLLRAAATDSFAADSAGGPYVLSRTLGPERLAVRGRDWKYVAEVGRGRVGRLEVVDESFYDLAADPDERTDRAEFDDAPTEACRAIVRRRLAHEREAETVYRGARDLTDTPAVVPPDGGEVLR